MGLQLYKSLESSIVLKKSTTSDGTLRSVDLFASAYLDLSNELLLLNFENCSDDTFISVTNLSTNEVNLF